MQDRENAMKTLSFNQRKKACSQKPEIAFYGLLAFGRVLVFGRPLPLNLDDFPIFTKKNTEKNHKKMVLSTLFLYSKIAVL